MRATTFAAALLAAVIAACNAAVAESGDLLHLTGPGIRDVIIRSDETWILAVLEGDDKCGEDCKNLRKEFAKIEQKSGGLYKFAYTNAGDNIVVPDGSLQVVGKYFNITAIPALVVWPAGPKRMGKGFRMEHSTLAGMLSRGFKMFVANLRMFVASALTSPLRAPGMLNFMTKEAPLLPRVLLLSDKKQSTATYASLSTTFASRGVFGQAPSSDKALMAAFGNPDLPALFVSPAGPHIPPPKEGNLTEGVYADWTRFKASSENITYAEMKRFLTSALPLPEVPVLTGPSSYRINCGDRTDVTVCFIAVLPSDEIKALSASSASESATSDEGSGSEAMEQDDPRPAATLRRVAARSLVRMNWEDLSQFREVTANRLPLAFMAVDEDEQASFAANLKASGPGLIALNPRKKVFTVYKGDSSFSEASLYEYVLSVMDKALAISVAGQREVYAYGEGVEPLPEHVINLEKLAEVPQLKQQKEKATPTPAPAKKKKGKKGKKKASEAAAPAADSEKKSEL